METQGKELKANKTVARVHKENLVHSNAMVFNPDYTVTSTVDHNGHLLKNVEVICCFWGTYWTTTPPPSPSTGEYAAAITGILTSPYMNRLAQYRGIGKGTLIYCDFNDGSNPSNPYTDQNLVDMLKSRFQHTAMPQPAAGHDRFYVVIVPPGIANSLASYAGQHQSFDYNGHKAYYAWVDNTGSLTGGNSTTKVFSHEMVEACTDPDVDNGNGYGILVNGTGVTNDEIGDTCNSQYATVNMNGVNCTVQSYWSKEDNACVLPVNPPVNATLTIVGIRKAFHNEFGFSYITEMKATDDATGKTYWLYRNEVVSLIAMNGNHFFVNGNDGTRAAVFVVDGYYVKTVADHSLQDNLLSMPAF